MMVAEGILTVARRPRQPRRRRRPWLGHAGGRRRRGGQDHRQVVHGRRRHRQRGRLDLARRHDRRGRARRDGARRRRAAGRVRRPSSAGPTRSAQGKPLGVRANADTGEDAANARRLGAEGIGLCRTEHMFLAPDRLPVVRRMILANTARGGGRGARRAAQGAAGRLHRDPRGDGRPAGHGAPARPAAARVPAVGRGAAHQGGHRRARRRGAAAARAPPRAGPSTTR